jgi:hypothetical protein
MGTLKIGKTQMRKGVSIAVPLIPVSMATLAMRIQAGNMNQ